MRTYKNEEDITEMQFGVPVNLYCPLGKNHYRASISITIELNDRIVDFIDLEKFFKVELNGQHLTAEQACNKVLKAMAATYEPKRVKVIVHSDSHFDIRTIKEWNQEK